MLQPFSSDNLSTFWPLLVEGALVSVSLGLIGCFLVVRGMSLLGDALSHSVLPGIVVGFLISGALGKASLHSPWILIGATLFGLGAAVLVQVVQDHSRVKEDASLGIVFTTLFALGVVLISKFAGSSDLDANCVLYGDLSNFILDPGGIWPMAVIFAGLLGALLLFYRQLLVVTFDPALARSLGIPATLVHYVLMGVLSLTIVASFEAVGAILAVALLVLPGATARMWVDRMPSTLVIAVIHGILSTVLGYWLSHSSIMNTSAAGAICFSGFVLFLLSWLFAPTHGIITRMRYRSKLIHNTALENLLKAIEEHGGVANLSVLMADLRIPQHRIRPILRRALTRQWVKQEAQPSQPETFTLTDTGRLESQRLVRAHELWEKYLRQEVGLEPDHVHDAAEWIEHHLDREKMEEVEKALQNR